MSEPAPEPRRTWLPFLVALSAAVLVIVGSVLATWLTSRMSGVKADAVRACEAAYDASAQQGEILPRIIAGDVYGSGEWRDLWEFEVAQDIIPGDAPQPTADQTQAFDDEAAALASEGRDRITVVWWLDSEVHWQCVVDAEGEAVLDDTAVVGPIQRIDELTAISAG